MKILRRIILAMLLTVFMMGASPANAQTTDPLPEPDTVIQAEQNAIPDSEIESRLSNIFSVIDGIDEVTVSVSEGVVILGGQAANEAQAQQAMKLALRFEGVVTVVDEIERTLGVKDNVAPMLEDAKNDLSYLFKALPLIGFALLAFILIGLLGLFISRRKFIWNKVSPNPFLADILSQAVKVIFWLIGLGVAMKILGAGALLTGILGGAGVVGIAISFAVRDSLENYISSIMLSLRQPFRARDHVRINDHEGIVIRLTSRATVLMTLDGNHLRIPNSVVFKGIILNYTTNPERRFAFELGVDAEDNPIAAMQVGLDAIKSHDFVLDDPKPGASIATIGDSNIVIKFTGWVNQSVTNFSKARSLAISSAMMALEEEGFTMPEPIYRLRFDAPVTQAIEGGFVKINTGKGKVKIVEETPDDKPETVIDEETLDVSPDTDLQDKVSEELAQSGDNDLLDQERPTE